ncbi:MAG: NfeD family protein [Desulfobacteraceae bacterium]|jgi:membrane-bound serine protease (ClpP class)
MNNAINLTIILQLVGILVIIAEIIIPSGGILAILAIGVFGYSLYIVFSQVSATAGMLFVMADLVIIPVLVYVGIKFLAKSPVTLSTRLSRKDGVTSQDVEQNAFLGMEGLAVTDLRPAGVAIIDQQRIDVVTRGEYLEKETEIVVTAVRGNQIVVKQKE